MSVSKTSRFASYLMVLGLLCSSQAVADENSSLANYTSPILISAPFIPGHVDESGQGVNQRRVSDALKSCGFEAEFRVTPFGRHLRMFEDFEDVDAVMTVPTSYPISGFRSTVYAQYQPALIIHQALGEGSRSSLINQDLRVVTFRHAPQILGLGQFGFTVVEEITDLRLHLPMLLLKRVDAIIGDPAVIIATMSLEDRLDDSESSASRSLKIKEYFPPTQYQMAFKNQFHRDAFNRCWQGVAISHQNIISDDISNSL